MLIAFEGLAPPTTKAVKELQGRQFPGSKLTEQVNRKKWQEFERKIQGVCVCVSLRNVLSTDTIHLANLSA